MVFGIVPRPAALHSDVVRVWIPTILVSIDFDRQAVINRRAGIVRATVEIRYSITDSAAGSAQGVHAARRFVLRILYDERQAIRRAGTCGRRMRNLKCEHRGKAASHRLLRGGPGSTRDVLLAIGGESQYLFVAIRRLNR